MISRSLLTVFLLLCLGTRALAGIVFTSLPNPNVYPMFIILDQQYLAAEFVPARGGVAQLLALLKSGKANVTYLNRQPAQIMADQQGWQPLEATIRKAVYLISYAPVTGRDDINRLKIISAFPGGSPDMIFRAGNFSVTPKYTDLFMAIQLFLKKDFDALLLPEPHISRIAGVLREKGIDFTITDMQEMAPVKDCLVINGGVALPDVDTDQVKAAFDKATAFIRADPERAARIIAADFQRYFGKEVPEAAVLEALASGRLLFATEESH